MPDPDSPLHCPWDGRPLDVLRTVLRHRAVLHKCPACRRPFLSVYDERNVYPPLLPLHDRRAEKAFVAADDDDLEDAFKAVQRIDSVTLSIQDLERALVQQFWAREPTDLTYRLETGDGRDRLVGACGPHRFALEVDRTRAWAPHVRFPTEAEWDRAAPEWAQGLWDEAVGTAYDEGEGPIEMRVEKGAPVTFW